MARLWSGSMEEMSMAPWEPPGYHVPIPNPSRAAIERSKRRAAYHYSMAEKYGRAERYPWMPLWPDPPEPE